MEDMENNQDLIEESDISPVMPSNGQIDMDEIKDEIKDALSELPNNKNKKYITHHYTGTPLVYEKLAESVTSLDKISKEDHTSIEIKSESAVVNKISKIALSPGNNFIAGWCEDDGILAVWSLVDNESGDNLHLKFTVKTSFNKFNIQDSRIHLSISEDGHYVAISRLKSVAVEESPDMDSAINLGLSAPDTVKSFVTPQTSFAVYSTIPELPHISDGLNSLENLEMLGPLLFIHDSKFVFITRQYLYICTTKLGIPIYIVDLNELIKSVPEYSHESNLFLLDCYDMLSVSLRTGSGYMLWPENNGLSIWDLDGMLKQWFYVDPKNPSPKDCLYAISESGELIARFSDKPGMVSTVIFHTPTGLRTTEISTPKTVFFIAFLNKHDQIVVCSTDSGNVRVQLWDCWSGVLIKEEENHPNLDKDLPLALLDDQFVHTSKNEIVKYPLFPNENNVKGYQVNTKELSTERECKLPSKKYELGSLLESNFLGYSVCSIYIHKKEKIFCKFKFEPWRKWGTADLFMKWLDNDGNRILLARHDSVQIYKTKPNAKGSFLKVELQYIWTVPFYKNVDIKFLSLETLQDKNDDNDDFEPLYRLKIQLTNSETIILPLPAADDKNTYQIFKDACASIHLIRLCLNEDLSYVSHWDICVQLKKLILNSIDKFSSSINKISLGDGQYIYPMEDFILFEWNDVVTTILNKERYIPLFHNDERSESALALLIELQKSDLLDQLISYIIRHVRDRNTLPNSRSKPPSASSSILPSSDTSNTKVQQPGFAWTVGAALLDLYRLYPDKGTKIMREWSYLTTSLETPTRILRTNLGNPLKVEERSFHSGLKTVSQKALLPKKYTVARDSILKIIASKLLYYNIFSQRKKTMTFISTTATTASFVSSEKLRTLNAGSSEFAINILSENKKDFQQIRVHRQRQRKQRLNKAQRSHPAKLCVVPLPDFCVYPEPPKINNKASIGERIKRFWATYVSPTRLSSFAEAAIHGPLEMFSEVAMEAIIEFKWEKYARKRFLWTFCAYLVYAFLFCLTVSIDPVLVSDGDVNLKMPLFALVITFSLYFLIQELRQMLGQWRNYWTNVSNYLDLASFSLPLITCWYAISKHEPSDILKSYAVLLVWLNAVCIGFKILMERKFISIVLEIIRKIKTLVLTLAFMVVGFANALFVLLRDKQSEGIPHFSGSMTNSSGAVIGNLDISQPPNLWWSTFPWAIFSTYKFLGIGWETVNVFDPDWALLFMVLLFNFITVIILLNVLIGLIVEVFNGSLKNGRQAWLRQRAQLISEIELYSITPAQRNHAEWFPHLIYYESHLDSITGWRRHLYEAAMDDVNSEFIRNELKEVKSDVIGELKEVKGIVGQIRIFVNPESGENEGKK
ncbi:268_t:CDS:2 [Dentiscutata heterogama]|uniref:268_t:CDS:1 n=1 Tax=Dentiscutata heterogama TaxID=1316150 RepID=A0ACA9KFY2_9GLOM|nr:268_t:CDS:2 [Dentiscutata heterogama]